SFFFQAEDGIRDPLVTGVQTCALPIFDTSVESLKRANYWGLAPHAPFTASGNLFHRCQEIAFRENTLLTTHLAESREEMEMFRRSEERRVGKECSTRAVRHD